MLKLLLTLLMSISILSNMIADSAGENVKLQIIKQKPVIDGKLNDFCWQNAKWYKGLFPINKKGNKAVDTEFALLYKDNILYIGVICNEKIGEKIVSKKRKRDGSVYSDDSIEFMLITHQDLPPDEKLLEYMHFIVNSDGQKYDAVRSCGFANKTWNANWKAKTKVYKNKWTLEVAIDCTSFDIKSKSPAWHFNICRSKPGQKYASWAKVNSFHQKRDYPLLTNIPKKLLNSCFTFSDISFEQNNGLVKLKTNITNNGTYAGEAVFKLVTLSDKKEIQNYSYNFKTSPEKQNSILISTKIKKSGTYRIFGIIKDNNEKVLRTITKTLIIAISPLKVKIITPSYRNNIYHTQKLSNIELLATLNLRKNKTYKLTATLTSNLNKNVVSKVSVPCENNKRLKISLPVKNIKSGTYNLHIALIENSKRIAESKHIIKKLAQASGTEVRIDRQNNIIVNGEKFFPWGFMGARANKHSYLKTAGFNTIQSYSFEMMDIESAKAELNKWHKAGIKVILYPYYKTIFKAGHFVGSSAPGISSEGLKQIRTRVKALMSHPAILGWYLCDEPRGPKKIKALEQVYNLLRKIDPYHPCFVLNNSVDGCLDIQNASDILYPDIYPNFKEQGASVSPLSIISNSIKAIYRGSKNYKPVILAAQTFDYGAYHSPELYRAPSYDEVRSMVYLAIISKTKGLVNFKIGDADWRQKGWPAKSAGIYATKSLSIGILEGLGPEINTLAKVFLAPKSKTKVKIKHKDILFMTRETKKGDLYIICVNKSSKQINAEIGISSSKIKKLNVFPEARSVIVQNNKFRDSFAPYEAHVYTTDFQLPAIKTVKNIKQIINSANR